MPLLNALSKEFTEGGQAEFRLVYICEAHALDEWPMGDGFGNSPHKAVNQPKSVAERIVIAKHFREELKCEIPTLIDGVDDHFERAYSAWPLRFYIIHHGKIAYKAQPTPSHRYSVSQLRRALMTILKAKATDCVVPSAPGDPEHDENSESQKCSKSQSRWSTAIYFPWFSKGK